MSKEQDNNSKNSKGRKPRFNTSWIYTLLMVGVLAYIFFGSSSSHGGKQLAYTDFQACLDSGYVNEILVNKDDLTLRFALNETGERYVYGDVQKDKSKARIPEIEFGSVDVLEQHLAAAKDNGRFDGKVTYERDNSFFWTLLLQIGPILLIVFVWFFIMNRMGGGSMGGGGIFSFGKSKAKLFDNTDDKNAKITFKDVAGQTEAKREVHEIVDFLKNPKKYTELGGKIPKGALLVGPPGTGKTLLAKAVAGEADVPFFSMSGSDFVEMFVGVGASRVRDLFQQAKAKAPCIIFIDEIDAIGRARGKNLSMGGNDERENTLNQLLTEMDGFGTNSGVIILAATNRAEILDKALLRAGRFDRQIHVDLPDLNERKAIFHVHLRPIKIDETVDVDTLARQTPGFSGADIANVCNEAALIAARNNSQWVNKQCFLDAVDRIIGGLEKKTKVMTDAEKRTIALHEAGHATISWFCQYANPLVKVTIVPRGQALGAAWYMPEERQITTKEEMLDEICATLGGRAAEELCTGRISTGAMNDLETVTKRSYGMIAYAGMSDSLPNLCYYNNDEYSFSKPYSEHTAELIDEEVKKLIAEQYARAKQILLEHKDGHEQLAQLLIDREVIYAEDVERIFGKRPWISRTDEILAANEDNPQMTDDEMNHENENAEIIRKKVIDAVLEKQKNGDNAGAANADSDAQHTSAQSSQPVPPSQPTQSEQSVQPSQFAQPSQPSQSVPSSQPAQSAPSDAYVRTEEPKPFQELKVTTFENSYEETYVADAAELEMQNPAEVAVAADELGGAVDGVDAADELDAEIPPYDPFAFDGADDAPVNAAVETSEFQQDYAQDISPVTEATLATQQVAVESVANESATETLDDATTVDAASADATTAETIDTAAASVETVATDVTSPTASPTAVQTAVADEPAPSVPKQRKKKSAAKQSVVNSRSADAPQEYTLFGW